MRSSYKNTLERLKSGLVQVFKSYADYGIGEYSEKTQRRMRLVNLIALYGFISGGSYALFYFMYDFKSLWSLGLVLAVCSVLSLSLPLLNKYSQLGCVLGLAAIWMPANTFCAYALSKDSGLHFVFVAFGAIGLLLGGYDRKILALGFAAFCLGMYLMSETFFLEPASFVQVDPFLLSFVWTSFVPNTFCILFFIIYFALRSTHIAEEALEREHQRSERLLDNILPKKIADRLKSEPDKIIADSLGQVTILFADIVDFTPKANSMEASDLVAFLNTIFSEFDRLTEKRNLEKIKTIGDAYMVAAGIPEPRFDHASAIADLGLEMLETCKQLTILTEHKVEIRIGMHVGPVVAGVIGTRKFFYDVWGDTVNTAARMESQGEANFIQVTEETRDALKDGYTFKKRGKIEIKGKGPMTTWWLTGKSKETKQKTL